MNTENLLKKWDIDPETYEKTCNVALEAVRSKTFRSDVVLALLDLFANGDIPQQEEKK